VDNEFVIRLAAAAAILLTLSARGADEKPRLHALPDLDKNVKTGPAVGAKIPSFESVDQNGTRQTFESLRGPKGLALLFVRSADW
jgi:hypothetical protein